MPDPPLFPVGLADAPHPLFAGPARFVVPGDPGPPAENPLELTEGFHKGKTGADIALLTMLDGKLGSILPCPPAPPVPGAPGEPDPPAPPPPPPPDAVPSAPEYPCLGIVAGVFPDPAGPFQTGPLPPPEPPLAPAVTELPDPPPPDAVKPKAVDGLPDLVDPALGKGVIAPPAPTVIG